MAKSKKLEFRAGDKVNLEGVVCLIVSTKSGNMVIRPLGGPVTEDGVLTIKNPVLAKSKESKQSEE